MDRLRVFISSTIKDLEAERQAVEEAVREMRYEPVRLEALGSISASALEASLLYDDLSDIYLGIIGARYGDIPSGEARSVTESEFWRAREIGLPTLVYVKEPDGTAREEKEQEFLERVQKVVLHAKPFKTTEELISHVKDDLDRLVTDIVRKRLLPQSRPAEVHSVLIASLGRAPGAVTGLYQAIRAQLRMPLQEVVSLSAHGSRSVQRAVNLLAQEFAARGVKYTPAFFDADDLRGEPDILAFKIKLIELLRKYQNEGAEIYLGIAGGRSSMGALIAMVAAIEAPSAYLYHFWVPEDVEKDGDIESYWALPEARRREVLFPREYSLVKVPFVQARAR